MKAGLQRCHALAPNMHKEPRNVGSSQKLEKASKQILPLDLSEKNSAWLSPESEPYKIRVSFYIQRTARQYSCVAVGRYMCDHLLQQ